MKKRLKIQNYFFLVPVLFVVIVKVPHLSLPYFWDEAWSYFPAAYKMYETSPGILPGALPLWDAKGHPLFFFFVSSIWMRLVGTSVFWVHVLPFLISIGTLLTVYLFVKKQVNIQAANFSVLLLSAQALFLSQSSMLLPEMLLTLLLIASFHFYFQRKYWLFALTASLMVMTKETSIVFIGGFLLFHLFVYLNPDKQSKKYIQESTIMLIPILIYAIFLVLHKRTFGMFFFTEHTNYIELNKSLILNKLQTSTNNIFWSYGRFFILMSSLIAVVLKLIKKEKFKHTPILLLIVLQFILFLSFSALNFYTQRYMLGLLTLFIIASSIIFTQVKLSKPMLNWIFGLIIVAVPTYYTFTKKTNGDNDLGYVNTVKVFQEMVGFCEENDWQNKNIASSFNMIFALRNPHLGYTSSEKGFSNVTDLTKFRDAEIFIEDCTAWDHRQYLDTIKSENMLLQRFEREQAWGEIYIKNSELTE